MSTSIRLPPRLLARVDARAKALGVSRNEFLVSAIEAGISVEDAWPPALLALLETPLSDAVARAFEEALGEARRSRRNRSSAPRL